MRYYVRWKVEGRYTSVVEANSIEEAKEKAREELETASLNEMEDIWDCDTHPIAVEDDKFNTVWEE